MSCVAHLKSQDISSCLFAKKQRVCFGYHCQCQFFDKSLLDAIKVRWKVSAKKVLFFFQYSKQAKKSILLEQMLFLSYA